MVKHKPKGDVATHFEALAYVQDVRKTFQDNPEIEVVSVS